MSDDAKTMSKPTPFVIALLRITFFVAFLIAAVALTPLVFSYLVACALRCVVCDPVEVAEEAQRTFGCKS